MLGSSAQRDAGTTGTDATQVEAVYAERAASVRGQRATTASERVREQEGGETCRIYHHDVERVNAEQAAGDVPVLEVSVVPQPSGTTCGRVATTSLMVRASRCVTSLKRASQKSGSHVDVDIHGEGSQK